MVRYWMVLCIQECFVPCENLLSICIRIFLWALKGFCVQDIYDPQNAHFWKMLSSKKKNKRFFKECISLFGITTGNIWISVFFALKTMKYSFYRYCTICLRNFNTSAYWEVNTCVTKMQDEP